MSLIWSIIQTMLSSNTLPMTVVARLLTPPSLEQLSSGKILFSCLLFSRKQPSLRENCTNNDNIHTISAEYTQAAHFLQNTNKLPTFRGIHTSCLLTTHATFKPMHHLFVSLSVLLSINSSSTINNSQVFFPSLITSRHIFTLHWSESIYKIKTLVPPKFATISNILLNTIQTRYREKFCPNSVVISPHSSATAENTRYDFSPFPPHREHLCIVSILYYDEEFRHQLVHNMTQNFFANN